jgi:hypothetical protein
MHRRRWICTGSCDESFKSKNLMEQHMREKHPETFTETKLPVLLDICERAEHPNEPTECPLCPDILPLSRLQSHLALHLEELALFVLPVDVDDAEREDQVGRKESHDDGSNKAVYNRAVDLDDLPSLSNVSAASLKSVNQPDVSNQASDIFSQLLKGGGDPTEEQVQGQVESWREGTGHNLTSTDRLAQVLNSQGRYEEAERRAAADHNSNDTSIRGSDRESEAPPSPTTSQGQTPLSRAAVNGDEAVARLLLEKGADVAAKEVGGRTALHWAVVNGHESAVAIRERSRH